VLVEAGLRIGEALGLRHEDVCTPDGVVEVRQRVNANRARAKTWERTVPVGSSWLRLHADYLHEEYGDLDSDYNSAHLHTAAARRRERTLQRARDGLRQLEADGGPITFDLVARTAGVSRAWLYTEPAIRDAIPRLRAAHRPTTSSAVPASQRASDASLLRRLEAAHARNRELDTEIRQLREQLARAHGQLRAARLTPAPPSS
jgi:integrase